MRECQYLPKSRYYECVTEFIIKYILSKFKYLNTNSQRMDKIWFITNTVWCVIIVSLIVILNLLKINIALQLPIILILMIPLTYVNYHVTKSILIFLNFTENDSNYNEEIHKLSHFSKPNQKQ